MTTNLTERDLSILVQVAFKEAAAHSGDILEAGNDAAFAARFEFYFDQLRTKVETVTATATTAAPRRSVEDALVAELGATPAPAPAASSVEIVVTASGGQHGPLPEWFLRAAAEKGVTRAFDNRDRLASNPKSPWFKSADDRKIPFWPPRGK